jgi:hypothetical protein
MKVKSLLLAVLSLTFMMTAATGFAQDSAPTSTAQSNGSTPAANIPLDKLVTATCRQAWHLGGRTQEGFFSIVEQLTALSAQNRGVTLPDDKDAGARAGQWIRTQAMKDPDQLLYAIVDQAVQHSIAKGRATPASAKSSTPSGKSE